MKTVIDFLLSAAITLGIALGAPPSPADGQEAGMEQKAADAIRDMLRRKDPPHFSRIHWFQKVKRDCGVSDEAFLTALIAQIKQEETVFDGVKNSSHAFAAAIIAMELFPGNPRLEEVVLDECRRHYAVNPKKRSSLKAVVAGLGSDEALVEMRKILTDPNEIKMFEGKLAHRDCVRFARKRIPEGVKFERWTEELTGIDLLGKSWPLLSAFYCVFVLTLVLLLRRKRRRAWIVGSVAIVAGIAITLIWPRLRGVRWSSHDDDGAKVVPPVSNLSGKRSLNSLSKPDVRHLPKDATEDHGHNTRKPVKDDDTFMTKVREIMSPFAARDPQDRAKYLKDCDAAGSRLLDLLEQGRPENVRPERWDQIVRMIVEHLESSDKNMDRCVAMLEAWISGKSRSPEEALVALQAMIRWRQMTPIEPASAGLKRFERIANLQISLLEGASPAMQQRLISNLEGVQIIVKGNKEQVERRIVDSMRLAGLIEQARKAGAFVGESAGEVLNLIECRIADEPESFPIFEETVKKELLNTQTDLMGRLTGYRMVASVAGKTGQMPAWIGDREIASSLANAREAAPKLKSSDLGYIDPRFVSLMALDIIKIRMNSAPDAAKGAYEDVLMGLAGAEAGADMKLRMNALDLMVTHGVITSQEAVAIFGNDPAIGDKVAQKYPPK